MKFTHAIVRKPGRSLVRGLSSADLGPPDYLTAVSQHRSYLDALSEVGVKVMILEAEERFPDSVFVEDAAVVTPKFALVTRPGAPSRQGEEVSVKSALEQFFHHVEAIDAPGTLEGGDVMMVDNHFYIGLSQRTNENGANQFISILKKYGFSGSVVPLEKVLHLKTGLAYLQNNKMVVAGEFVEKEDFARFDKILVDENESYAANCIWVNGSVIMPAGYSRLQERLEALDYRVITVDVSEFRKLDGGVSCMSLRF